jgi:hypothetical protein
MTICRKTDIELSIKRFSMSGDFCHTWENANEILMFTQYHDICVINWSTIKLRCTEI